MSKQMKLNLGELKVTSFLTSLDQEQENEIKGGLTETDPRVCTRVTNCTCLTCGASCGNTCDYPCTKIYACIAE
jgi:hypothetical protein